MTSKSGEIILALMVGLTCAGIGMAALTHRHNAIVARDGGVAVDFTRLGKRSATKENPGTTAAIIAASIAAGLAVDQIHIGDNYVYIQKD